MFVNAVSKMKSLKILIFNKVHYYYYYFDISFTILYSDHDNQSTLQITFRVPEKYCCIAYTVVIAFAFLENLTT